MFAITADDPLAPPTAPPRWLSSLKRPVTVGVTVLSFLAGVFSPAHAQQPVLERGDAVVTGFSGIRPSDKPLPEGANPLDHFFIDLDGPSAQIMSLNSLGAAPSGQRVSPVVKKQFTAREIGQVFAITFDDGEGAKPPATYLASTLAYGAHIVGPDNDLNGAPDRLKKGAPGAQWMPGLFGPAPDGNPGTIWRVDGQTGEVAPFTTLPGNSGPGIGDIVFDKRSKTFYASDLDTGLINQIGADGVLGASYDHGVDGRPAKGLAAVADDGSVADISSPAFDSEAPSTWGFTQNDRMVYGMAIHQDRLYYAVTGGHQIWSIGLTTTGDFAGDPRWEVDVTDLPGNGPITDMLFDDQGRMVLATRGTAKGSYKYAEFATPMKSEVVRYTREQPADPATPSVWVPDAESYAIGMPEPHFSANGGIALGYGHTASGNLDAARPREMLWSTGERLRPGVEGTAGNDVHGLQGNDASLVRPQNEPPQSSYFVDYDGKLGDDEKAGHLGDVEILTAGTGDFSSLPPQYLPPGEKEPENWPDEWPDPEVPYNTNLRLTKTADPEKCIDAGANWFCVYEVRVENTGPDDYFGPVLIKDSIPVDPNIVTALFAPMPPWACWSMSGAPIGPDFRCLQNGVFMHPGESVGFQMAIVVKKTYHQCEVVNLAEIEWAPGGSIMNTDPTDDADLATALIPTVDCDPKEEEETNLRIYKKALDDQCLVEEETVSCRYRVRVENMGPGVYSGELHVFDRAIPSSPISSIDFTPAAQWDCNAQGGGYLCEHKLPPVNLNPTQFVEFDATVSMTLNDARERDCKTTNKTWIVTAAGGTPQNTDPTDDQAQADHVIPQWICDDPGTQESDLTITKELDAPCTFADGPIPAVRCTWNIEVQNVGPNVFNGPIQVTDEMSAPIQSMTDSGLWNCVPGAAVNEAVCDHPVVNLGVGESRTLQLTTSNGVHHVVPACEIANTASITSPLPGTPKNLIGPDIANAAGTIPAEVKEKCQQQTKSNLKLEKQAATPQCNPIAGGNVECVWQIDIHNTGPADFTGEVELNEMLPGEPVDASFSGLWTCEGVGGGPGAICKHPETTIAAGDTLGLTLTTSFSQAQVQAAKCELINTVEIAQPAGATDANTDPTDDTAQATATVASSSCYEPPKVECPAGYVETQDRCVRRDPEGPNVPPVPPSSTPDPVGPAPQCRTGWSTYTSKRAIPRGARRYTVKQNGIRIWCAKVQIDLTPPQCRKGWRSYTTPGAIPNGWKSYKTTKNGMTIWCARRVNLPGPQCRRGWKAFNTPGAIPKNWKSYQTTKNGQTIWCGKRSSGGSADPQCRTGWRPFPTRSSVPSGWRKYAATKNGKTVWCGKRSAGDVANPKCRSGWKSFPTRGLVPSGWRKYAATKNGKTIWCGKRSTGGTANPQCRSGWKTFRSRNAVPNGWKKYSTTKNGKTIWCGKKQRTPVSKKPKPNSKLKFKAKPKKTLNFQRSQVRKRRVQ